MTDTFTPNARVAHEADHAHIGTVVVAEPDYYGLIVVRWDKADNYELVSPKRLRPVPKRYVVELRAPVVGERIIYANTATTAVQDDERTTRFVIVDEVTP